MSFYKSVFKRLLDFFLSLTVLLVASPVLVVVTFLLAIANNGKPFFFQHRPGKNGRIFSIVKFKTMNDRRDAAGNLLPDTERLTKIGKIVRSTSFDELPQLINVLKGDMSLVGPRPLLVEYLPLYSAEQARRHEVKPGITGWAQINGRNAISWEQKFGYDVWYVTHVSLILDIKILLKTFRKVFYREGISADTHAEMAVFKGSK